MLVPGSGTPAPKVLGQTPLSFISGSWIKDYSVDGDGVVEVVEVVAAAAAAAAWFVSQVSDQFCPSARSGSRNPEGGPLPPARLTALACHICKYVRLTQAASPCNASLCFCRNIYTSVDLVQTNAFSALSKAHRERSRIYTGISCAFVFAPFPFLELIFFLVLLYLSLVCIHICCAVGSSSLLCAGPGEV